MLVEEENIYCPEYISGNIYTVVGSVDLTKPMTYKDTEAVVAGPDNMYVSQNAIYFLASAPWYLYNTWQLYDMGASADESGVKYVIDELVGEVVNKLKAGDEKTKSTLMKLTIDKGRRDEGLRKCRQPVFIQRTQWISKTCDNNDGLRKR